MNGPLSFRRYRAAFFFVVALLAAVTAFTLWNELRTNARIDELFGAALEREALIARIRVDAAVLENTVDDHIRATDDDARQLADARMEETLADAKEARLAYTQGLPEGEKELWKRFDETARALAQSARVALRFSNRREAERARQHLEAELRPIAEQLNALAGELAHKDAQETRALLHRRESLRTKTTFVGALVALSAVALAVAVGTSMVRVLRRQEHTIQRAAGRAGPSQPRARLLRQPGGARPGLPADARSGLPDAHPPIRVGDGPGREGDALRRGGQRRRAWPSWSRRCCASAAPASGARAHRASWTPR